MLRLTDCIQLNGRIYLIPNRHGRQRQSLTTQVRSYSSRTGTRFPTDKLEKEQKYTTRFISSYSSSMNSLKIESLKTLTQQKWKKNYIYSTVQPNSHDSTEEKIYLSSRTTECSKSFNSKALTGLSKTGMKIKIVYLQTKWDQAKPYKPYPFSIIYIPIKMYSVPSQSLPH